MKVEFANALLEKNDSTCIILKDGEIIYTSSFIGVKPLLVFMKNHRDVSPEGLVLVDKVIGKAALMLAARMRFREIYTPVTSLAALASAKELNISLHAAEVVPYIKNRTNTGMCPIEMSVIQTNDLEEAYININEAIRKLMAAN